MARGLVVFLLICLASWIYCDSDEDILLSLKKGISDGSGAMENWVPGTNICNWTGISCDITHTDRVQSVILSNRKLKGTLTPLLGQLPYLRVLDMDQNNLTGNIPATLENCSFLTNISLGSNLFTGPIPRNLDRLVGLQRLDLWNNMLEGTIPATIGNCTDIDYLSLGQNFLYGNIPSELGKLNKLLTLRLFTNNFVGPFPVFFTNCTSLQVISLRNNSLTGHIPKEIEKWTSLQQLRIQSNMFDGTLPPEIGNMTSLYYIDISSNRLTGNIPATLGSLTRLQELHLNNNSFTGRIPHELSKCPYLATLELSYNQLEGPLPYNIGDFAGLANLTLDRNLISGNIPPSFGNLVKLINLDLSYNLLNGTLPPSLAGLTNIQLSFNLAHNKLSGSIPSWIGDFKVVQNISLQFNNFSGNIPSTLGKCVGLQSLDLSYNQLTGPIPDTLTSLQYLTMLNLSFNRLTGEVPLKRFNMTSYIGNSGLCGEVLNKSCVEKSNSNRKRNIVIAIVIALTSCITIGFFVWAVYHYWFQAQGLEETPLQDDPSSSSTVQGGLFIQFSQDELERITDNYAESNVIGEGGYSRVYRGKHFKDYVAVKLLKLDMQDDVVKKSFFAELETLGRLRHRNLVRLLGYCWTAQVQALVLDYMPNGSVERYLRSGNSNFLNWQTRLKIALGVAHGMAYLHHEFDSPVIHCDLKPGNILLDEDLEPHVADFGISRIAYPDDHASVSVFRGSIGYSPPEYGSSTAVTTKGDVYSYGIFLLELVTGRSPTSGMFGITTSLRQWVNDAFPSRISQVIDPNILSKEPVNELEIKGVLELALYCTEYIPNMRLSMKQVVTVLVKLKENKTLAPSMEALIRAPSPYTMQPHR